MTTYWSSTEDTDANPIALRFDNGRAGFCNKFDQYHLVRPVRAFSGLPCHR